MVLAYFDTCVWLSALFTRNSNHSKAIELFEKVKSGDYIVIVTHYVLDEILDVLKKEAVITTRDEAKAEALTKQLYSKFSKALLKLPNVFIKNPNVSTHNVLRPSFSLLFKHIRGILLSNNCPICNRDFNYVDSDTIFRDDAIHAMLAWALNCDVFVTFDKDFLRLVKEPILYPMKVDVLS